jgi:hypothetical protein
LFQLRRIVSDFFAQFTMCRFQQCLARLDSSSGHLPAIVFAEDVSVLSDQYNVLVISEGKHTNTFPALDHAIDSLLAIWHLSNIFSH